MSLPRWSILTLVALVASVAWWALPPFGFTAGRVATRLAAEAGCPRPVPTMPTDADPSLDPNQLCGVLWTAMNALPDSTRVYLQQDGDHLRHVRILTVNDYWAFPNDDAIQSIVMPPRPWWHYQRVISDWRVGLALLGTPVDGVYDIGVDRRTGMAYRTIGRGRVMSSAHNIALYLAFSTVAVVVLGFQIRATHRRLSRDMRG